MLGLGMIAFVDGFSEGVGELDFRMICLSCSHCPFVADARASKYFQVDPRCFAIHAAYRWLLRTTSGAAHTLILFRHLPKIAKPPDAALNADIEEITREEALERIQKTQKRGSTPIARTCSRSTG